VEKLIRSCARFNSATASGDLAYPIGTVLLVSPSVSPPAKNGTTGTVYHNGNAEGWEMTAGTPLTGTWRSCGLVGSAILVQRVA